MGYDMLKALTLNQWDDTDLSHQNGHQKIGPSPLGILFLWFVARGAKLFAKKYAPWPWVIGIDLYNVIFPKRIDLELQGDFSGFLEVTLYPKTNMTGWKITNLRSNIFRFCIVPWVILVAFWLKCRKCEDVFRMGFGTSDESQGTPDKIAGWNFPHVDITWHFSGIFPQNHWLISELLGGWATQPWRKALQSLQWH